MSQLTEDKINELAKRVYQQNKAKGWWDDPNRCFYGTIQLASTELSEATEGLRKDLMDDKLKHRVMEEVELADCFIRVVDIGGRYDIEYENIFTPSTWDYTNFSKHGMHLYINKCLVEFADTYHNKESRFTIIRAYSKIIKNIIIICELRKYDLLGAIEEKLIYNKTRPDHSRENRAKKGGKAF